MKKQYLSICPSCSTSKNIARKDHTGELCRNCSHGKYQQFEIDFLKENYAKLGAKECATVLKRTYNGIKRFASILGLKSNKPKLELTRHVETLKQNGHVYTKCKLCGEDFSYIRFQAKGKPFKYCSQECYFKTLSGSGNPGWKGGKKEEYNARLWEMSKDIYKNWRIAIFKRDKYACQECGLSKQLNAHHIMPWAKYPELRYELDNGKTLCKTCHKIEHGHKNITAIHTITTNVKMLEERLRR